MKLDELLDCLFEVDITYHVNIKLCTSVMSGNVITTWEGCAVCVEFEIFVFSASDSTKQWFHAKIELLAELLPLRCIQYRCGAAKLNVFVYAVVKIDLLAFRLDIVYTIIMW